jgi:ribosomal protein S18 acetylase RimI-like enzyme
VAAVLEELKAEEARRVAGLGGLLDAAWAEARGDGPRPASWPVLVAAEDGVALTVRRGGALLGYAWVRSAVGMNMVDFVYALPGAERSSTVRALVTRALEHARARGRSRIFYVAFNFWRLGDVAAGLTVPFPELGMRRLDGVYMARGIAQGLTPPPVPDGYRVVPWSDDRFEEACDMMLRAPEPEPIYWDRGLCRRSILGAAAAEQPLFPDGLGQLVLKGDRLVAFSLATPAGYVNHVYTDPDHRSRGLARCALMRVLAALAGQGLGRATILTHANNPGAIRLYERLGFRVDFVFPQFHTSW